MCYSAFLVCSFAPRLQPDAPATCTKRRYTIDAREAISGTTWATQQQSRAEKRAPPASLHQQFAKTFAPALCRSNSGRVVPPTTFTRGEDINQDEQKPDEIKRNKGTQGKPHKPDPLPSLRGARVDNSTFILVPPHRKGLALGGSRKTPNRC